MPNTNMRARGLPRRAAGLLGLTVVAVGLTACGVHISKNGISGSIDGHQFSAAVKGLPAGFPGDVPLPGGARTLGGAGTNGGYDAAFAVPGVVGAGTQAYESKFRSAGYSVTDIGSPSTTELSGSGQNATSTTVTLTGASFTAKNASWTVQVEMGSSSSAVGSELKAGEFGINITVVPAPTTTSP
jgi:hypothetical protein